MINSTLCYIKKDGKTLLLKRNKKENDVHEGKWIGLGGKFESSESPEDCVIREVYEESGLKIENPRLKAVITFPKFKDNIDWYVFLFEAFDYTGEMIESNEGDLEWIDDEKIDDLNMWDGDRLFFQWMRDRRFFSGKISYENGELIDYEVNYY